jgi:hypothetical protein
MLRIFSTHRLFGFLLIGLMITSCGGNTSSNTPSTGTSSKTSVTPITSNTTPQPQKNDYTSQCNATDFACIVTQTSKWQQDLNQWLQGLSTGGSGGTSGTKYIMRQYGADTYADCARIGDPSLNCDLDLRGVP